MFFLKTVNFEGFNCFVTVARLCHFTSKSLPDHVVHTTVADAVENHALWHPLHNLLLVDE